MVAALAEMKAGGAHSDWSCVEVAYKLHQIMIELRRYQLEDESAPVTEWLAGLRDMRARAQIEVR